MSNFFSFISLAVLVFATATSAVGATTICKVNGGAGSLPPKAISWDTESKKAKVQLEMGDAIEGRVTLAREHKPHGMRFNLTFSLSDRLLNDELEFMIFPVSSSEYRIIGVGYRVIPGGRALNTSLGNHEATCNTL